MTAKSGEGSHGACLKRSAADDLPVHLAASVAGDGASVNSYRSHGKVRESASSESP